MEREELYRGKRPNSGKWITGHLFQADGFSYILHKDHFTAPECACEVLTESVGQFIGLTDKNGVKIFKGDVVNFGVICSNLKVYFDDITASFRLRLISSDKDEYMNYGFDEVQIDGLEIIGNIYQNEKLIKLKDELIKM